MTDIELLRELHETMVPAMQKVEAYLKFRDAIDPRNHPPECTYHVDQYPNECTCGRMSA